MSQEVVVGWRDSKGFASYFRAWERDDGTLVELRDLGDAFDEIWLRKAGIPENVLDSARDSKPQGYALLPTGKVNE